MVVHAYYVHEGKKEGDLDLSHSTNKFVKQYTLEERIEFAKKEYEDTYLHPDTTLTDLQCCVIRMELVGKDDIGKIERLSKVFSNKLDADIFRLKFIYNNTKLLDQKHSIVVSWNDFHFNLPIQNLGKVNKK